PRLAPARVRARLDPRRGPRRHAPAPTAMCLIRTAREWSNPAVTEDTLLLLAGALSVPYVITSVGIVPYVAGQKGRSGLVWILLSLLVSPVIALLALAAMPVTRGGDDQMAAWPSCAGGVKTDAVVCQAGRRRQAARRP